VNEGNNDIIDSDADWNLGRTASFQAQKGSEVFTGYDDGGLAYWGSPLAASLECLTKKLFFMVMSGWIIVPFTLLVAAL
jgi:hypothetical protein